MLRTSALSLRPLAALAALLALLPALWLALPGQACAKPFKTAMFAIELPAGWSLINGPFKRNGGEMAVLGRRDHKASVQLMYGPTDPAHFRDIVEGYARSMHGTPPVYEGSRQASFDCTSAKAGQSLHLVFRSDDTGTRLLICIFNGRMEDMLFIARNMTTPYPGLVPSLSPVRPAPSARPAPARTSGRQPARPSPRQPAGHNARPQDSQRLW
ncbi:MAG: hypothetical protein IKT16_10250 [Desulfovibrio sp.]|nr:hypothetical protein [Desulfovibrio sp.]